ncbi:hypothetical protein H6F43_16165 [Leptolyngbya sp. FACHB-36]|uniref:glycosyltransferase family 9 protein n=1 Tax=Leptolyngbya sp. FACHB-36 TaxID=2692808 RepID=UPI00167FE549|nr:hypothetical protein [Leptolyngbya sp. FACHB-36]MBD2021716.1 hypothetical protein [Leptolyngbya sp. FACHB-36]
MRLENWQAVQHLLVCTDEATTVDLEPAIVRLRQEFPNLEMTLLTWAHQTDFDTVAQRFQMHHLNWTEDPDLRLVEALRDRQFDAAIILTAAGRSPYALAYLCYLAGIPIRLGQSCEFGGGVLSSCVAPAIDPLPAIDYQLRLLESAGFPCRNFEF